MDFSNLLNKYKKADRNFELILKKRKSSDNCTFESPLNARAIDASSLSNIAVDKKISSVYFISNEGSVTHYYHFLFGALVPLLEYHLSANLTKSYNICTDIGPMKSLLCELPINLVSISGPSSSNINDLRAHDDKSLYSSLVLKENDILLPAYDIFNNFFYNDDTFPRLSKNSRLKIVNYIKDNIPCYIQSIPTKSIILIERSIEPYYHHVNNNLSHIYSTSGSERRAITNHQELLQELTNRYGNDVVNLCLERCSIYYQMHMFSSAKLVIAQHGAALSNIFFMTKSSHVIEISPPWSKTFYHFRNLCHFCEVEYDVIDQSSDKSDVDIDLLLRKVDSIANAWCSR